MFESVLVDQNPHWDGKLYGAGVKRDCFDKLLTYLRSELIVSVLGVRRAGKSTLLKQLINHLIDQQNITPKNILFLNLEHPFFSTYSKEVSNLEKVYEDYLKLADPQGTVYCLLDEIQYFKDWQVFVKAHFEQKNVRFVVTGSNAALVSADLMTLLSGRTLPLEVYPLSCAEIARAQGIDVEDPVQLVKQRQKLRQTIDRTLQYGAFPQVILSLEPDVIYETLNAYAKTILYQDVAPRLGLRKSVELERLFYYLVSNIGKPFSYTNLSQLFDLTDKIIKEYIAAFADSYLLFELEAFDFSLKKQIKSPKKVYSIDTGQINAVAFQFTQNKGRLLENLVFLELRRLGLELYYYKTKNNLEVDFLAKKQTQAALIQVAWEMTDPKTLEREQKALEQALRELELTQGLIISYDEETQIVEADITITVMPAYKFFCLSLARKFELLGLQP